MKTARLILALFTLLTIAPAVSQGRQADLVDDPAALSTLTALLRNHESFAKWVDGKPLGEFTSISVRKDRITPNRTTYVLVEFDAGKKPLRFLRVDENAILEPVEGGALEQTKLRFEYPAAALKPTSFDHPTAQRAIQQMLELQAAERPVLYLVGSRYVAKLAEGDNPTSKLENVSKEGIALVRLLSRACTKVTETLKTVTGSSDLEWDPSSVKRIRFEVSPDGREVSQVEIGGLFKPGQEELVSPDAASVAVILQITAGAEPQVSLSRPPRTADRPPAGATLNFDTKK